MTGDGLRLLQDLRRPVLNLAAHSGRALLLPPRTLPPPGMSAPMWRASFGRPLDTCKMSNATVGAATNRPDMIRLPLALRVYAVVFSCIWCGGIFAGLIAAAVHGSPAVVILLLMLVIGLTLGYRIFRLSVVLGPQDLLIRNYYRTRRIARADVEGFRQGSLSQQPFTRAIDVLLRDGTLLPLDVTGRPYFFGRGTKVLEERLQLLRRWLEPP